MYRGDLSNVPPEIAVRMLELQVQQGNPKDVKIFESNVYAQLDEGGFDWDDTPEGGDFWERVLEFEGYRLFFDRYGNKSSGEYNEGDYVVITEYKGNTKWSGHWFEPREVLKLGGSCWQGSIRNQFAACSLKHPNGNGMGRKFQEDYKIRLATTSEIEKSQWGTNPCSEINVSEYDLAVGDTYINSMGNTQVITNISKNGVVSYAHNGTGTVYSENRAVIISRLKKGLYKNYKSSKSVNQLKTSKNEVHRENQESGTKRGNGTRAIRRTVTLASASRPVGGKISNSRKRSGARKSTISGKQLFAD